MVLSGATRKKLGALSGVWCSRVADGGKVDKVGGGGEWPFTTAFGKGMASWLRSHQLPWSRRLFSANLI